LIGESLRGRYEVLESLGGDGMFENYLSRDRQTGDEVSVRILNNDLYGQDFESAAGSVIAKYRDVDHPGIEKLLDIEGDSGKVFLVSEYTPGVPIGDRIRKLAPFSVPVAVSTGISLCEDLEALHHQGLVHGDLNAGTVYVQPDGQVRLQLAGLWQVYASSPKLAAAAIQSMAPYLAPEISSGDFPSPAADLYAVGVLLYQLLTGRLPYNADSATAMAVKHATVAVPTTKLFNQAVPGVLDEIVKKCLAKDPAERYRDASDLLADLKILQDALRFGKTISWPLRTPTPTAPSVMPKQIPTTKTKPVAVKKAPPAPAPRRVREPSDVPLFMIILIAVFSAVVLTMFGIWIAFTYNKPTLIKVPSIKGMTVEEATSTLRKLKLQLRVSGEKMNDQVSAGHIVSSEPSGGDQLRENGTVFATLSSGSRYVRVPDLKGATVDEARSMLRAVRLDVDDQIVQRESANVEAGHVIAQDPAADSKGAKSVVEQGSKIKLIVSSGIGENSVEPNKPAPTSLYTLKVKLTGLDAPVELRVEIEDDRGVRDVYEKNQDPEETVILNVRGTGERVKFRIYYDDELVREVEQNASEAKPLGVTTGR
jgi:serine/threonine-protein kinase